MWNTFCFSQSMKPSLSHLLFSIAATLSAVGTTIAVTGCSRASTSCDDFEPQSKQISLTRDRACTVAWEAGGSSASPTQAAIDEQVCNSICGGGWHCSIPFDYVRAVNGLNSPGPSATDADAASDGSTILNCPATPEEVIVTCSNYCEGRFTDGAPLPATLAPITTAKYFERCAHFEWVSVSSFRRLASELSVHGAPSNLIHRARSFAYDEVRHTQQMEALVSEAGGNVVARARVSPLPIRPLLEMALENAIEGCVRETFGALIACVRAKRAHSPLVREIMNEIADDESRHSELGFEILEWSRAQLSAEENVYINVALESAIVDLETWETLPSHIVAELGDPTPSERRPLIETLRARVWAPGFTIAA